MATGGTFTYVDNRYGESSEQVRRKVLSIKHVILIACYVAGYLWVWDNVFAFGGIAFSVRNLQTKIDKWDINIRI